MYPSTELIKMHYTLHPWNRTYQLKTICTQIATTFCSLELIYTTE